MMERKELGKIEKAELVTNGGYGDGMFGIRFELRSGGTGVGDFWGYWGTHVQPGNNSKWTEENRASSRSDVFLRLETVMRNANVKNFNELKGVPIEITYQGNMLKSWRVLTEVV